MCSVLVFAVTCMVCAQLSGYARGPVRSDVKANAESLYSFTHPAMGTTYSLLLYARDEQAAAGEAEKAFDIVDDVEELLSNYRPQSELSRINRDAYAAPVTTDPETFAFLKASLAWSARSDGAFDITVGALMKAWGFFRSTGRIPSAAELAQVGVATGWHKVQLDPEKRTVRFTARGVELDPGGIGKGFAVDRVIDMLRTDGVQTALISAGSSTIYGLGAPPGKPGWLVDVPDPGHPGATIAHVLLRDTSLSTASCAEKHFVLGGHLYCHIMDPRISMPVEGRLQATVITPSATDGDALSNVMFVDDAAARTAVMQRLNTGQSALVFSGIPAEDRGKGSGQDQASQAALPTTCDGYRWSGSIPSNCSHVIAEGKANTHHTRHRGDTR